MIKLKDILTESSLNTKTIIQLYSLLKQKTKKPLSGGNCGQSAYAIHRFIRDTMKINTQIGVITNESEEEDLVDGEPDVYHIFIVFNKEKIDENGVLSNQVLSNMGDEYGNPTPDYFIFDMPRDERKVLKIISSSTDYNADWNYFYDILEKYTKDNP